MAKFSKQYVYILRNGADKTDIRKWIGKHNGVSIAKSDWVHENDDSSNRYGWEDCYILTIKNEKTELLYVLSFPNSKLLEDSEIGFF